VKQLIWKELREQRFIPLGMASMVAVVLIVWCVAAAWLAQHHLNYRGYVGPASPLTPNATTTVLMLAVCGAGVLPGGGAFANENGGGTVVFIATMPGGRSRAWWAKTVSGLIVMAASCVAVFAAYCATLFALYGSVDLHSMATTFDGPFSAAGSRLCYLLFALIGYSVCQLVSAVVDRSVVAVVVGLILSAALLAAATSLSAGISWNPHMPWSGLVFLVCMLTLLFVTSLGASHSAFCRSDLAQPSTRFPKAGAVLAVGAIVLLVVDVMLRALNNPS